VCFPVLGRHAQPSSGQINYSINEVFTQSVIQVTVQLELFATDFALATPIGMLNSMPMWFHISQHYS
jgi:hypothetical protein